MSAVPSEDLGDTAMALQQVRQRMAAACQAAGRAPEKVRRVSRSLMLRLSLSLSLAVSLST